MKTKFWLAAAAACVLGAGSAGAQQPIVIVQSRRSVVWPLVACAMVAVAAGALYLVWQQTQRTPSVVTIDPGPGRPVRTTDSGVIILDAEPADERAPTGSADPPATPVSDPTTPGKRSGGPTVGPSPIKPAMLHHVDPYTAVLLAKQSEVNRCVTDHGLPPPETKLQITVAPDGHPRDITFEPASVDGTPLGTCIKNVLRGAVFPHADKDRLVPVTLIHRA